MVEHQTLNPAVLGLISTQDNVFKQGTLTPYSTGKTQWLCPCMTEKLLTEMFILNIYIFIAIALDESIFLDVLHFPMKNIKSCDLEATPMGGATSKRIQ